MRDPANDHERFETLARTVFPSCKLLRHRTLKGGISAQMTALELERGGGGPTLTIIVRQPGTDLLNPNVVVERELRTLRATNHLKLRSPVAYANAWFAEEPCLLLEYIEGSTELRRSEGQRYARRAAEELARIHSAELGAVDVSFLPRQRAMGCFFPSMT